MADDTQSPQIGPLLQQIRKRAGLTLDNLASLSGVSRSMLSQIERGQTNPTLATVWALANALRVDMSELIGARKVQERQGHIDVASPTFTPEIRTEDGLCVLRILSPAERADSLEWYELRISPGGRLRSAAHAPGAREHLTVFDGQLDVTSGAERATVVAGATARYHADVAHEIANLSDQPSRALLIVIS